MIYVIPMTAKIACAFLDTDRREATFIFMSGYDLNVTKDLFDKDVPEGGKAAEGESALDHVNYHGLLQTTYNAAFPNTPLNCSDTAKHAHYLVNSPSKCSTFYLAFNNNKPKFGLNKAAFMPGGAFLAFSPPQGL